MEQLSFSKAKENVTLSFTKKGLAKPPVVRLAFCGDLSYSMDDIIKGGLMDLVGDRLLAAAAVCDDNGELEVYGFSNECGQLGVVTEKDYQSNFFRRLMKEADFEIYKGTTYSGVLELMIGIYSGTVVAKVKGFFSRLFGKTEPVPVVGAKMDPALILYQTDGDCDAHDKILTKSILAASKDKPIFIQFVGLGPGTFHFLRDMATEFSNVDFLPMMSLSVSDTELYSRIFSTKFLGWYENFRKNQTI